MPDRVGNYVDLVASRIVDLEELVEAKKSTVGERYVELLNNPAERLPGIWEWFSGYLAEHTATETGNVELAEMYWAEIDKYFGWSWDDLHSIPEPERGDIWSTARRMISATAQRQAMIDSGLLDAVLQQAAGTAVDSGRAAARLTTAQKREVASQAQIKSRAKEEKDRRNAARSKPV